MRLLDKIKKASLTREERDRIEAFSRMLDSGDGKAFMAYLKELEMKDNIALRLVNKDSLERAQGRSDRLNEIVTALTLAERMMKEK